MKRLLLSLGFLALGSAVNAQVPEEFVIEIEPIEITNAPGVHSYSWGKTSEGKWLILGGRIDGLHQRQPFAAFLEQDNNKSVYVIDPVGEQVWSADLSVLSTALFEQLQSTNQQFKQREGTLYITGGYGYSTIAADHITHDGLVAIDIDGLANAVINGTAITSFFRSLNDPIFKVTGGQLGYLDSVFYLVGGHLFDGAYNPMGPDHGPGFVQIYTNDIRAFKLDDNGTTMNVYDYNVQHDTVNLHRRDYNMVQQIFPDGTLGFTAFSGVFDYADMPYLNTVDVTASGYTVNNTFNQYLSQYHSAKLPIYDTTANVMHTLFFGGLSQFAFDDQGILVEDPDVPFVKTISRVSRFSDDTMQEVDLNYVEMPTLVGPGAEFIPTSNYFYDFEILDLNALPQQKTLVGYIYGGIESTEANIFFINNGTQSSASNVIFGVYINKASAGEEELVVDGHNIIDVNLYPNPVGRKLSVDFAARQLDPIQILIHSAEGKLVYQEAYKPAETGTQEVKIDVKDLVSGPYILTIDNGVDKQSKQFVKK